MTGPLVEGIGWRLSGLLGDDGTPAPVPEGTDAWILLQDGRLTARTGCNSGRAGYTLSGDRLSVGPLATTRMACVDDAAAEVERTMVAALQGESVLVLAADRLLLTAVGERSGLAFRPDPAVLSPGPASRAPRA